MARTLGIPARIAVGFLPVSRDPDVPSEYTVSTDDLHAWPELHFDGVGWVRFEPTPSRGAVPAYAADNVPAPGEELAINPETGEPIEPAASPTTAPDPAVIGDPTGEAVDPLDIIDGGSDGALDGALDGPSASGSVIGGTDARLFAALLVALLLLALAVPGVWRARRRARRRRSPDVLDRWRELRDTARDLGLPADETSTPRGLATAWASVIPPEKTIALDRVRSALEARAYAHRDSTASSVDLNELMRALRQSAPWWRRVLAVVAPVSLLDRSSADDRTIADALAT